MRRERVAQSMRRGSVGQPERAAQPRHRQLHNTRRQGFAARSNKKRPVWGIVVRTKREVVGDRLRYLRKHGYHARLIALSSHGEAVGPSGEVFALQAKSLRYPQTASVKKGKHGRVTCDEPWLAFLALTQVRIGDLLGDGNGERLCHRPRQFRRTNRGECPDFSLSVSLEKACERAAARKRPHQRAIAGALAPPRSHEGANVSRGQLGESFQRRCRAQM